jgi:surfactin synthase thioesterase subunit
VSPSALVQEIQSHDEPHRSQALHVLTPSGDPWVQRPRATGGTHLRVFCFPHAGGTAASFRGFSTGLPGNLEVWPVQLPGRGSRFREQAFERFDELLPAVRKGLLPHLDRPFAFFGHSMGALVAFELVRELRRHGERQPVHLFVSAREAPHRPPPLPPLAHLPHGELVEEVRVRYGGIPDEVLAEPELLELLVPILRADLSVLESYAHRVEEPLDCPVSCLSGQEDRQLTREDLEGWRQHTRGAFTLRVLPGGHFFVNEDAGARVLRAAIAEDLRAWLRA